MRTLSKILPRYSSQPRVWSCASVTRPRIPDAAPLLGKPAPASSSFPLRGAKAEASAQRDVSGTCSDRLRGRFSQTSGEYAFESLFGTSVRTGTVLSVDPVAPAPRLAPHALAPYEPAEPAEIALPSNRKQQARNASFRMHAARMVLSASSEKGRPQAKFDRASQLAPAPHGHGRDEWMAILFPGAAPADLSALRWALHRYPLPESGDATVLRDVLACSSSGNPRLAREIVERVAAGIDLHDSGHLAHCRDQEVERGMWRTAQLLSRTDDGFRLLQALQPPGKPIGRAARIILQVSDHCLAPTGADPLPHALCAAIEANPQRRGELPAAVRGAAYRMLEPGARLSTKECGLIFAWEQGFREDGPGTALQGVKQRLAKFTHKSIPRVEASRWRSLASRICGYKKSPLTAMRMGMQGAHLGTLATEREARNTRPGTLRATQPTNWDLRLSRPRRDEAAHLLDRLIVRMQSSSRVRFTGGGRRGFSLQGLTIGLSNFLHTAGIPLGIRLNLSRHRGKRSGLEIARTTGGGEIIFGTETRRQNTMGAGAIAGYDFDAGVARLRCGFGVDLARTRQARRSSGVVLRVARRRLEDGSGYDDQRMQSGMRNIVRCLFEESSCKQSASEDAVFDRFASRFFNDPDVSLGAMRSDGTSLEHTAAACVSLTASIATTGLRVGPSVALSAGRTSMRQRSAANAGGRLQATAFQSGAQTDLAFTAGLNGKIGSNSTDVGLLNSSLAQVTIPLNRQGHHGKARLMRESGRLQPHACSLDLEFTSVEAYARAIAADIAAQTAGDGGERTRTLASKCADERTGTRGETDAPPVASNAGAIAAHLASARHHARANQTFVIRKRLNAGVARVIDRNANAAETIRGCHHLPPAQRRDLCRQLESESADLLAQPDSWETPELKVMARSGRLRRVGLQSAVRLANETSVEGERCLATLVLDTAT